MFLHLVVVLSLCWPPAIRTEDASIRDDAPLDQIATASENVPHNRVENEQGQKEFHKQLIESTIDTTVHYENSNGFVPIAVAPSATSPESLAKPKVASSPGERSTRARTNSSNGQNDSGTVGSGKEETGKDESDKMEDDPAYSTEARIFLNIPNLNPNRRSFEYQNPRSDFDLLKVRNDTPVVATYPDFFEGQTNSNEGDDERDRASSNRGSHGNYGTALIASNDYGSSYGYHSSRDSANDKGKVSRQSTLRYDGWPKSNAGAKDTISYDTVALLPSQVPQTHRFSKPVVVAEPSDKYEDESGIPDPGANDYRTSRIIDAGSSEVSHRYTMDNRDGRFRSDEDSRDLSEDTDYPEQHTERPRRVQKGRRRPNSSPARLPKEHRNSLDDSIEYENQGKRHPSPRSKPRRQRPSGNSWLIDEEGRHNQDDSYEDARYEGRLAGSAARHGKTKQNSLFGPSTRWNQISPSLEISHSSGIELGQLEKPKLVVPVKVNLVPVANFDHATAIGNSQGFDVSDAVLRNMASAGPVSTASPSPSPSPSTNAAESVLGPRAKLGGSTPIPDIIVGQNSFQNTIQAIYPQPDEQQKFLSGLKARYVSSTISPMYAVSPGIDSNLQSIPNRAVQVTPTPRPAYVGGLNQASTNHLAQVVVPQPTVRTVPALLQTPVTGSDYIQISPHGMQGQNLLGYGSLQVHPVPTMPTITPTAAQAIPVSKFDLLPSEFEDKRTGTNFLASASLAFGQSDQRPAANGDGSYTEILGPQLQSNLYQQMLKNVNAPPKTKEYVQATHLLPAVLHPVPTLATIPISATTPQPLVEQPAVQGANLFLQAPRDPGQRLASVQTASPVKTNGYPTLAYQTSNIDSANALPAVLTAVENAHLPHVATRNVEIVNPNIKPSPVDTAIVNSYGAMHYPAAVLTTSIPMFAATSYVSTRPAVLSTTTESASVQNLMNSFAEIRPKYNQPQDRPAYNPINFVPNTDVLKNQNALNGKLHASESLQQNLNLVPLVPGGSFFRPPLSAQTELIVKPKLASDLETYAEQMFKESLKTIYNSQKWNNDRKNGNARQNVSDSSDIATLRSELQRLKASLSDSRRNKEQIEGHHSEAKPQAVELPAKQPDKLLAALEQVLKNHPTDSLHTPYGHGHGKPPKHRRPGDRDRGTFAPPDDFGDAKRVREFLAAPQLHSHRPKGQFHDKPGTIRHGPPRYHSNRNRHHPGPRPRPHPRTNFSAKVGGPEASASNLEPLRIDAPSHHESGQDPSFAAASFDRTNFLKGPKSHQEFDGKENFYNHPKVHNLLGLLMKNKQLPRGGPPSYSRGGPRFEQLLRDAKQRMQQQLYDDTLNEYLTNVSEGLVYSNFGQTPPATPRSWPAERTA